MNSTDEVALPSALHLDTGRTEREELVLRFMLAMAGAVGPFYGEWPEHIGAVDSLQRAAERADVYLKWCEGQRK